MGHLLKGIRSPEHPLQWMKRCVRSLQEQSAPAELGLGRSSFGQVGTSLGAALALLWISESPDPDNFFFITPEG